MSNAHIKAADLTDTQAAWLAASGITASRHRLGFYFYRACASGYALGSTVTTSRCIDGSMHVEMSRSAWDQTVACNTVTVKTYPTLRAALAALRAEAA